MTRRNTKKFLIFLEGIIRDFLLLSKLFVFGGMIEKRFDLVKITIEKLSRLFLKPEMRIWEIGQQNLNDKNSPWPLM